MNGVHIIKSFMVLFMVAFCHTAIAYWEIKYDGAWSVIVISKTSTIA